LAEAGVSVMAIATYDTDTLFVPAPDLPAALAALESAGHVLEGG